MNIPTKSTNIIDSPLGGTEKDLLGVSDYVNALSRFLSSASMPTRGMGVWQDFFYESD